jgi:putative cardiolipin synthase
MKGNMITTIDAVSLAFSDGLKLFSRVLARKRINLNSFPLGQRLALVAVAAMTLLGGCTTLDRNVERTPSTVLNEADSKSTALGRAWSATAPDDPALSGFRLLPDSLEAFAARVAMIDAAERTLDLQYFIFKGDDTGLFLVDRLVTAADRGVRVRILVDDLQAHGIEKGLAAFDGHANIEVRIYNPWTQRGFGRLFEFLFSPRLNHRMHNKIFIADGIVAILGGRNLADEYFDLHADFEFRDLDVLAAGPVVTGANQIFDAFWNGPDAIPISGLKPKPDAEKMLQDGRDRLTEHRARMQGTAYADAVRETELAQQVLSHSMQWAFAKGQVYGNAPNVTEPEGDAPPPLTLADQLREVFYSAKQELLASSPYFVPGKKPTERLCEVSAGGASVQILTNSLSATDMGVVHGGYSKYRKRLLEGGVQLFELRRLGAADEAKKEDDKEKRAYGSANASLHAKSFVVDQ